MKYIQENFQEITHNNANRIKASGRIAYQSPLRRFNSGSAYGHPANAFVGLFVVDWQLSMEENSEGHQ